MNIFTVGVLTVLTFVFITYPLFRQRSSPEGSSKDEKLQELRSKRDTTYFMLKELEFDFQSGILSEEDHQELEARYKKKAISILRGIDKLKESPDVEDEIEKGVRALRQTKVEDEVEKQILKLRQTKGRFCPQCGAKHQADDHFCSSCGTSLKRGGNVD